MRRKEERRAAWICAALMIVIATTSTLTTGLPTTETLAAHHVIYHGKIDESAAEGDEVHLKKPISVKNRNTLGADAEICGYTIYKSHSEQPFRVDVVDRLTGEARIVLDAGYQLDYEQKHKYNFEIAAYECTTGIHGDRDKVHIKVEDVNEFAPVWEQAVYTGSVEEGTTDDRILRVQAVDMDGSQLYSQVCHYHVITPDVPFEIDENGYVRNTRALQYDETSEYSLEVKAEDCGSKMSEKATVKIDVKEKCKPGWTGVDREVDVLKPMTKQPLLSSAQLQSCNDSCDTQRVTVDISLDTSHIGRGCDRDLYTTQAHRKICGALSGGLDLLPSPTAANSWTDQVPFSGRSIETIFSFDGKTNAVEVPADEIDPNIGDRFTVSAWLQHERNEQDSNPHGTKEHIVCSADGDGMNRHHFGLFIHNCRLILLLRSGPTSDVPPSSSSSSTASLRPAEWRWTLPEVCDGKWHHYAVSAEGLDQVRLYLDGREFVESKNNPEILDDWPLHHVQDVHFAKLTVGACWQGAKHRMGHYFRGEMTGLYLIKNETDSTQVLQCLNSCQEKLDISELDDMDTGMSVSMNAEMNSITIVGVTMESVERLVHNVGYINNRMSPAAGSRSVNIKTQIHCTDESAVAVKVPDVNVSLIVHETKPIVLTLKATQHINGETKDLIKGQLIFKDLAITAAIELDEEGNADSVVPAKKELKEVKSNANYLLDSCSVEVEPKVESTVESFMFPLDDVKKYGLELASTDNGFILAGLDKISTYENVLRRVAYKHSKPQDLKHRAFTLMCTEVNQRIVSNDLIVNLEVIHKVPAKAAAAPHAAVQANKASHPIMTDNQRLLSKAFPNSLKYDAQETGIGVAVVMVVCVGFVIMLIVLGLVRVRNVQRGADDEQDEDKEKGDWDQGGLNITVNPMDPDNAYEEEEENAVPCHEDDCSDSEEEEEVMYRDKRLDSIPMSATVGRSCGVEGRPAGGVGVVGAAAGRGGHQLKWDNTTLAL